MTTRAQTVTILFTDLVGSTELLQRAGDEQAQRIFKAHHRLLREAVEAHGGHEVKWLGDGLMVAFDSTADAVKCAIAMQQSSRRPTAGERLEIRAGLHVGEAFVDESDYFGTSVVIARRLCDSGGAGAIRASDIVVRLLDARQGDRGDGLQTKDLGALDLKGITNPVPAVEIIYEHDPMALLRKLPFVGRHDEYEAMLKKLAEARNGRGSVILLAGEPGIGKTRLTEEFCEHASSGATVIRGNCYEGDVAAPFGPWVEALRSLIEQTPDADLRGTLGPGGPDIALMMPEIRRRIVDLEESPRLEPEAERARRFDSINAWLRNAAEKKPLVIFLDDLHWCDRPSLALLEQVSRGCHDKRIVIVGTYRDVEVDRVHPFAQTLTALRRMEHHDRISLHGFTSEGVDELLASMEPSAEGAAGRQALAVALHAESEGNPFFIREVLNHLVETGTLRHEGGRWQGGGASVAAFGIPEGIREVIGRRLLRLSEGANRVLQRASAMTSGFTWDELRAISEESEDDLLDVLDEALGSQIIAERERSSYAFTHALVRATLYDELSAPRRVQLHRRIGEALEQLYAGETDAHAAELAHHFALAVGGGAEKAVEYATLAGDQAAVLNGHEDAAAHYERALHILEAFSADDQSGRCELLLKFGDSLRKAGEPQQALTAFRQASDVALGLGDGELLARAAVGFAETAWRVHGDASLRPEAFALLTSALAALAAGDSALRVKALGLRVMAAPSPHTSDLADLLATGGMPAYLGGRDEGQIRQAREAVEIASRMGDASLQAYALFHFRGAVWLPDNPEERLAISDEMLRLAREAGDLVREFEARAWRASDLLDLARVPEFSAELDEMKRVSEITREPAHLWYAAAWRAGLTLAQGDFVNGERDMMAALQIGQQATAEAVPQFGAQLITLRIWQGRGLETAPLMKQAWEQSPNQTAYLAAVARDLLEVGHPDDATPYLERLAAVDWHKVPRDFLWLGTFHLAARAAALAQDRALAAKLYDLMKPCQHLLATYAAGMTEGSAAHTLAGLAAVLGSHVSARIHFEDALAIMESNGLRPALATAQCDYAQFLLSAGEPHERERALELLREALATAQELGMPKVAQDAEGLLASLA